MNWHIAIFETMLESGEHFRPTIVYRDQEGVKAIAAMPSSQNHHELNSHLAAAMLPYTNTTSIDAFELVTDSVVFHSTFELGEQEALVVLRHTGETTIKPYGRTDTGDLVWKESLDGPSDSGMVPAMFTIARTDRDDQRWPLGWVLRYLADIGFAVIVV